MLRRDFLKWSAAAGGVAALVPRAAFGAPGARYSRLLVLVELKGANDGLNTVVPYADPAYYALRPRIGIKRDEVASLDERFGFHPALAPLLPLWRARELAIVHGVGYANPNLSHFRSIEIWDTASNPDEYLHEGWLARAFAGAPAPAAFAAEGVVIGSNDFGPLAGGSARTIALANTEQFTRQARLAQPTAASGNAALAHILKVESDVVHAASGLASGATLRTEFPQGPFGNAVRTAAQVVASPGGVAVLRLTLNGFDTHQNQPGVHSNLLKQLAEGLVALKDALVELGRWESTLILTYSEFGRRAQENGSNGTDHGTASVQLALGGRVAGGFYGGAPRLDRLESGNLVHTVDFRSLYATVLERWWGIPSSPTLGGRFPTLDLVRA